MIRIRERRQLWQFVLLTLIQCFGSAWIRIIGGLLDPDPHGQIRIQIQEVKSSEIKLKSEKKIKEKECEEWKTEQTPTIVRILFIFYSFFLHLRGIFRHYLKERIFFDFFKFYLHGSGSIWTFLGSRIRIRIKTYADPKHCFDSVTTFIQYSNKIKN